MVGPRGLGMSIRNGFLDITVDRIHPVMHVLLEVTVVGRTSPESDASVWISPQVPVDPLRVKLDDLSWVQYKTRTSS